jgi:hypothetical protein
MAQCVDLYQVEHGSKRYNVPCGKCYQCRKKRVAGWSYRMMREERASALSFFITLTYDPDHLMFTNRGLPTLHPPHLQNFWKKLRKRFPPKSIKYYACGEYGSKRKRPHYHAILYVYDNSVTTYQVFNWIEQDWQHGSTFVGTVTGESVAYVLKYISKPTQIPCFPLDDRVKEFQRTSKGLGADYINEKMVRWHMADVFNRYYIPDKSGFRVPLPRYYKDKIYPQQIRQSVSNYMRQNSPERTTAQLTNAQILSDIKLKKPT